MNAVVGINEFMVYRMVITEAGITTWKMSYLSNEIYVGHQWEIYALSSSPFFKWRKERLSRRNQCQLFLFCFSVTKNNKSIPTWEKFICIFYNGNERLRLWLNLQVLWIIFNAHSSIVIPVQKCLRRSKREDKDNKALHKSPQISQS